MWFSTRVYYILILFFYLITYSSKNLFKIEISTDLGGWSDGKPKSSLARGHETPSAKLYRHNWSFAYFDSVILEKRYYPHLDLQQRESHSCKVAKSSSYTVSAIMTCHVLPNDDWFNNSFEASLSNCNGYFFKINTGYIIAVVVLYNRINLHAQATLRLVSENK